MVKVIGTNHGATKHGLGQANLGATGPGRGNPGTMNGLDTMGTGRKVSVGSTSMVMSGIKGLKGDHVGGGKMSGGLKNVKKGVMGKC